LKIPVMCAFLAAITQKRGGSSGSARRHFPAGVVLEGQDGVPFAALDDEFFRYPHDLDDLLRTNLWREGLLN
jgi:hypothetical protein